MNKHKWRQKVAELLDSPTPAFSNAPLLEFCGNNEVTVEGCRRILTYESGCISLACNDLAITFRGEGLFIRSMNNEIATVCGCVASVDFSDL